MKRMARQMALLLALVLLVPGAAAAEGALPLTAEKATITIATQVLDGQPSNNDILMWKEIEEATNVHVEWVETLSSAWVDKKNILMASGDLPDAIMGRSNFTDDDLLNFGKNGLFLPLNEYIDKMPNFQAAMKKHPEWLDSLYADDGNIYGLPYIDAANRYKSGNIPYINREWMEKLGIEADLAKPLTLEQFKQILIAFRDGDPNGNGKKDEIPWTFANRGHDAYAMSASFGVIENPTHFYVEGETVKLASAQEGYKAFVKWMHELWSEGLIDPEAFTQDSAVLNAKLKSPERMVGYLHGWRDTAWNLSDDDTAYTVVMPLDSGIAPVAWPARPTADYIRSGFVVTKDCENVELVLQWADYLYSEDISLQMSTNYKLGEHIAKEEDGTFSQIRALDWNREGEYNLIPGNHARLMIFDQENFERMREKPAVYIQKQPVEDAYEQAGYFRETLQMLPNNMWISSADAEQIAVLWSDIDPYVMDCFARWVTAGGIDGEWEEYLGTLEAMGASELVGIYQRNYDVYLGK